MLQSNIQIIYEYFAANSLVKGRVILLFLLANVGDYESPLSGR